MSRTVVLGAALLGVLTAAGAAAADEAKTAIRASLLLDLSTSRAPSRDAAYLESIRAEGPAPARSWTEGQVQPDGSVRYGDATVTVRNPCPPGHDDDSKPLPGRRSK
jgi:hypothetical protein